MVRQGAKHWLEFDPPTLGWLLRKESGRRTAEYDARMIGWITQMVEYAAFRCDWLDVDLWVGSEKLRSCQLQENLLGKLGMKTLLLVHLGEFKQRARARMHASVDQSDVHRAAR